MKIKQGISNFHYYQNDCFVYNINHLTLNNKFFENSHASELDCVELRNSLNPSFFLTSNGFLVQYNITALNYIIGEYGKATANLDHCV